MDILDLHISTSTEPVVDDYVPIEDETLEMITNIRYVSAIHITIQYKDGLKKEDSLPLPE